MKKTGFWLTVDGPNGTGKSLAARTVAERLRASDFEVVETREPGGTPLAESIRSLVLNPDYLMDTTTQLLLFNAARRSHIQDVIQPNVAAGRVVICDRFLASSLVFQSLKPDGSRDLSDEFIIRTHKLYCDDVRPDLSIYLDAPLAIRRARIAQRAGAPVDRFEGYNDAYDVASQNRFRECGPLIDRDFVSIDASGTPSEVADAIYQTILHRLAAQPAEAA